MMKERDLYGELMEGMAELGELRRGKITLKTHRLSLKAETGLAPDELKAIREKLRLSQAVFAQYLHTGLTTYQNWEQGRAKPNRQAVLLIRMVADEPATLATLAKLA